MDRPPAPDLTARFAADLSRLWPEGADGARLGLAVSGGPDSVALLLLAQSALPDRIEAATVDHGLREGSAGEAAMVAQLCARLGVPHETLAVAVAPGNIQHQARLARYGALHEWCDRRTLAALTTGHHLDDQAETLAMRLNRASGLAGLAGVRARGQVPGGGALPLLRPLLGWRRCELGAIVSAAGIDAVCDPSNVDSRFDRARLRAALAATGWLDPQGMARSASLLGDAAAYVADCIDSAWAQRVRQTAEETVFTPGPSDFEACEIICRILLAKGREVPRREAAEAVSRLRRGANASLGGILARVRGDAWVFSSEPPRNQRGG